MNLKDYQIEALKTALYPKESAIAYCTLGLLGELAELVDVDPAMPDAFAKELGDVMWYIATLAHETGVDLAEMNTAARPLERPMGEVILSAFQAAGAISNKAKKTIRDGKKMDHDFVEAQIKILVSCAALIAADVGITLGYVMDKNITKLADRAARGVIKGSGDNR